MLSTVPVAADASEIEFTISAEGVLDKYCRVRARVVVAESGEPLSGIRASISTAQGDGGGGETDADGRLIVEQVFPGPMMLEIYAPGREFFDLWFIAAAPETDLGEIRVHPVTSVQGTVVDEAGSPVRCSFTWRDMDRADRDGAEIFRYGKITVGSDEDGSLTISNLGRSRYLLYPGKPFSRTPILVDTRGGSIDGLVVPVSTGVEVKILTGAERTGPVALRVEDDRRLPVLSAQVRSDVTLALAPGWYTVRVDDGARSRSATFTVGSEPLEVAVEP